jgi:N-acyl-D-amino-acid deacylase
MAESAASLASRCARLFLPASIIPHFVNPMNRRTFVKAASAIAALSVVPVWALPKSDVTMILRGALVFDGTGAPGVEVDVALAGDRIAAVGRNLDVGRVAEVDLRGLALAPGFIDIHSHTDLSLLVNHRAESKVRQGVTTEVAGQDGSSIGPWRDEDYAGRRRGYRRRYDADIPFRDLAGFFRWLDENGASVNVASMVGQGTVRGYVVGEDDRPATDAEVSRMIEEVRRALADGACGMSSGLEYTPGAFASTGEIVRVASALSGTGLPYTSHMRNEDDRLLAAIEEAIHIGKMAGIPTQISHLKAQGGRNWWKTSAVFEAIEAARTDDADVMFDVYPYVAFSTGLANLFPVTARDGGTEAFLRRLQDDDMRRQLEGVVRDKIDQLGSWDSVQITSTGAEELNWAEGRRLGALAAERGDDPFDLLVRLIVEDRNRTGMVGFGMSEENVEAKLAHPHSVVCSDGGAYAPYGPLSEGVPHPRTYGAFPRVLGKYVRERGIMPLETAIHKMTKAPADRLRLGDRGMIAPGLRADLVAFDPVHVIDRATFENPHQYPDGVPHVWVGGVSVIQEGEHTDARPGRSARPQRS